MPLDAGVGRDPLGSHISYIHSAIHDSTDITVMKRQRNSFVVGVTTAWRTVLKGRSVRKVEDHCLRGFKEGTS